MRAPKLLWLFPIVLVASISARASTPPMVFFETGSARMDQNDEMILDDGMRWLRAVRAESVFVDGFTDRVGSAAANLRLSRRRAEAVRDALIRRGFPADRITIRAFGESRSLIDTDNGVAEPQNRYAIVMIKRMAPPAQ